MNQVRLGRKDESWDERKTIKSDPTTVARVAAYLFEALHHHKDCEKCQEIENRAMWMLSEGD